MNTILLDVTRSLARLMSGRRPTGIDRVSLAYVDHFRNSANAMVRYQGQCLTLRPEPSRKIFSLLLEASESSPQWAIRNLVGAAFLSVRSRKLGRGGILLNTGHSGPENGSYLADLRKMGIKSFFMVHDLIPIAYPEYTRPGQSEKHAARIENVLRSAHGICTNSRWTIEQLQDHAQKHQIAMPPSQVSPLGCPELPPPSAARPMEAPYFVMVGTIEPRKNHWLILKIWRKLIEQKGPDCPRLVIIGQRGWECENVLDLLERCESLQGIVHELADCSDADLSTYLHHAQALLFPSFSEGYGLPLIEAMSLGVPAIASDLPVFREIAGNIPEYLDPLDGVGWMQAIEAYNDPEAPARVAQLQRLGAFVPPTWKAHFEGIEEFLQSVT